MSREDLYNTIDKINPDDNQKQRMLYNILNTKKLKQRTPVNLRKLIPVCVMAGLILCAAAAYPFLSHNNLSPFVSDNGSRTVGEDMAYQSNDGRQQAIDDKAGVSYREDNGNSQSTGQEIGQDIADGKILNVFIYDGKEYHKLTEDQQKVFGFNTQIDQKDIGDVITTISAGPSGAYDDKSLMGCKVYEYKPAQSQAVVVVNKDGQNALYGFFTFLSYQKNQDEDASEYLKLYNVKSAQDISRIEIYGFPNGEGIQLMNTVKDPAAVAEFYNGFKMLKNASDAYFKTLFSGASIDYREPETAQDQAVAGTVEPVAPDHQGGVGQALGNSKTIRICLKSGIYMETVYYPNIKFLSRYQLSDDFADFLNSYCK